MDNRKKLINLIFVILMGVSILTGLAFILIAPVDINENENRYAEKLETPSIGNISDSVFQDSVELTAADQLPFADSAKKLYNSVFSAYSKACLDSMFKAEEKRIAQEKSSDEDNTATDSAVEISTEAAIINTSSTAVDVISESAVETTGPALENTTEGAVDNNGGVSVNTEEKKPSGPSQEQISASNEKSISLGNGVYLYKGYLMQSYTTLNANKERGNLFIENINKLIESYPDLNFYCYYIEKESDCQVTSGAKAGFYEYLKENINLEDGHMAKLCVDSFEDYSNYFYKTDHHWAYRGSYQGYKDIISMLKPSDTPLVPLDELKIGISKGSLTKYDNTSSYSEEFWAYEFAFPSMTITSAGNPIGYGSQASYISKARNGSNNQSVAYWSFYGVDEGEIVFHNPSGSGSILIFGNSYDNAVLKLIASHYEYVYSIDLRYYKNLMGHTFSFADYVANHHIDDVIHIGSSTYYVQAPFRVPD